jgi:hypothetical protein
MGWTDSHLHQFARDGKYWGVPEWDDGGELDLQDEKMVTVAEMFVVEGDSLLYEYDFGDGWKHEIVLEKIVPSEGQTKPVCIDGARRCPPEDVGGPHGYQRFLEAIFNPQHENFERFRTWAGDPVHAEEFSAEQVNRKLSRFKWPRKHRR